MDSNAWELPELRYGSNSIYAYGIQRSGLILDPFENFPKDCLPIKLSSDRKVGSGLGLGDGGSKIRPLPYLKFWHRV